jgi:hypothetical protein
MIFVAMSIMLGIAAIIFRVISGVPNRIMSIVGPSLIILGVLLWMIL